MAILNRPLLDRIRDRRAIRDEAIAIYRRERDAGRTHDEAADAVIANAKERYQPHSNGNSPIDAADIDRWIEIIQMIMQILVLFV